MGSGITQFGLLTPTYLCVALDKTLPVSEPQSSHLENRSSDRYCLGFLWGLKR